MTQLVEQARSLNPSPLNQKQRRELELRQIAILLAARIKFPKDATFAQAAARDPLPSLRRLAVQWVGEEKLIDLRPDVEKVLANEPMTNELFLACLASLSLLDGVAPAVFEKNPPATYILAIVKNTAQSAALRHRLANAPSVAQGT